MAEMPTDADPVRLVQGDALSVVRSLPDACLDAVITDPPYCSGSISEASRTAAKGQGLRSENVRRFGWFTGDNMTTAGLAFLLRDLAFECCRAVKPSGSLVVFCDWRMVPNLAPAIESAGLRYQNLLVWDKGSMGLGTGFRARHELAMHFTFGSPEYHAADAANVLEAARVGAADREHQAQKPVRLLRQIVRVVAPPGGLVFDPFAGSGSVAEAALQENRRAILAERDGDHCRTITRRLAHASGTAPGSLFAGAAT